MYDPYGYGDAAALGVALLFILPFLLLFFAAGYVITAFFLMKLFDKAGVQGKWRAWVPIYNQLVLAKLGDLSPWVMLGAIVAGAVLSNIPGVGFIFGLLPLAAWIMATYRVGLKLGKDWPLLLLNIIPGLGSLIWLGIAALSTAPWNPNVQPSPWRTSFLRDTTVWQGIPVQPDAGAAPAPGGYGAPYGGAPAGGSPYGGAPAAPAAPPAASYPPPAAPQQPTTPPAAPQPPAPPTTEPPTTPPSTEPPAPDAPRS